MQVHGGQAAHWGGSDAFAYQSDFGYAFEYDFWVRVSDKMSMSMCIDIGTGTENSPQGAYVGLAESVRVCVCVMLSAACDWLN